MPDNGQVILFLLVIPLSVVFFLDTSFTGFASSSSSSVDDGELVRVTKVIDGDTLIVEGGERVRLLGIDSEERGENCYEPARKRLKEFVEDKRVKLVFSGDKRGSYDRLLAYVFLNDTNINRKMVEQGFAVARIDSEDRFSEGIVDAEEDAMENNRGCEWSESEEEDICSVEERVGEEVSVTGEVMDSYLSNSTLFLNFGGEYPDHCFTAVVWDVEDLGLEKDSFVGEEVSISGEVEMYQGKPQVPVSRKSQIDW